MRFCQNEWSSALFLHRSGEAEELILPLYGEGDNLILSRWHCGYPGIFKHTLFSCAVVVCLIDFPRLWTGRALICNGVIAAVLSFPSTESRCHLEYNMKKRKESLAKVILLIKRTWVVFICFICCFCCISTAALWTETFAVSLAGFNRLPKLYYMSSSKQHCWSPI